MLYENGRYYWHGQPMGPLPAGRSYPPSAGNLTEVGVTCYSSDDLLNWRSEGVALAVSEDPNEICTKG
jgi:hypothetical protein